MPRTISEVGIMSPHVTYSMSPGNGRNLPNGFAVGKTATLYSTFRRSCVFLMVILCVFVGTVGDIHPACLHDLIYQNPRNYLLIVIFCAFKTKKIALSTMGRTSDDNSTFHDHKASRATIVL